MKRKFIKCAEEAKTRKKKFEDYEKETGIELPVWYKCWMMANRKDIDTVRPEYVFCAL